MKKKWITALALTGALTMGMTAMAEDAGAASAEQAAGQGIVKQADGFGYGPGPEDSGEAPGAGVGEAGEGVSGIAGTGAGSGAGYTGKRVVFVKASDEEGASGTGSGEGYMGPDVGYSGRPNVDVKDTRGESGAVSVSGAVSAHVAGDAGQIASLGAFLDKMDLGNHRKYVPYPMGDLEKEHPGLKSPVGQLQFTKNGITMTADVLNGSLPKTGQAGQMLSGLFDTDKKGNPSAEGAFKVMLFNQMLEKAPTVINEKILSIIADARKQTGEPIPFSIAHVDFRSVEPLHRVKTEKTVYTTGTRVLIYFDGWVFPMYLKAYVWQDGDNYRFVGITAVDSQKDAALEAGGALMEKIVYNG